MDLADFVNPLNFPDRVRELPTQFSEFPPTGAIPKGRWSRSSVIHVTIEQFIHLLLRSGVVGYGKNRGGQPINTARIKKWFGQEGEGLMIEALGEFPLGNFIKEEGNYKLPTHHHRSCFLLYLYWHASERIWKLIKDEQIAVRIFDSTKFVQLYCAADDMTKQVLYGFLRNPDMVVGHIISCDPSDDGQYHGRLSSMLSIPARSLLIQKSGHLQPLASLIYAHSKKTFVKNGETKDLLASHATLYNCRQKVKKLITIPYEGNEHLLQVDDNFLIEVAAAVEDYLAFRSEFQTAIRQLELTGGNIVVHRKILSNTAFFAFYIQDRVFFKLLPSAKHVAERLSYHCNGPQDLGGLIQSLWNNDEYAMTKRTDKITEVLRRPLPRKKTA